MVLIDLPCDKSSFVKSHRYSMTYHSTAGGAKSEKPFALCCDFLLTPLAAFVELSGIPPAVLIPFQLCMTVK